MVQGFCPLKVEIIQFLMGSAANFSYIYVGNKQKNMEKYAKKWKNREEWQNMLSWPKKKQNKQILQLDKTKVSLKLWKASTHFIRRRDRLGECSPE